MAFTAEQQKEMDRMGAGRKAELVLENLEKRTVPQLKARVNVLSVGDTITFAPENNYSSTEQGVINAVMLKSKWMIKIPVLLSDAQVLRDGGMAEASILAMLRQTNN